MDLVTIIYSILFYRMEKEWNFGWLSSIPKRSQLKKTTIWKKIVTFLKIKASYLLNNKEFSESNRKMKKIKEDKISINKFNSVTDLKDEIRRIIQIRKDSHWSFSNIQSKGSNISLTFVCPCTQ